MADIDLLNKVWCDLVFRNRNKSYGAYQLRLGFNRRMIKSMIFGVLGVAFFMALPIIISEIKATMPHQDVEVNMDTELANVKIDQPKPPPEVPDVPPPPPAVKELKFTEPKVVKQDKVKPTDIPPPIENVEKDMILGDENKDGLSKFDVNIEAPEDGTGDKVVGAVIDNKTYDYASIQKKPKFPGNLKNYISKHLKYPDEARSANVEGKVYVKFTIERDGSISNVKVVRGKELGYGLAKEAVRIIKSMPRWTPGEVNGKKVNVSYIQPFSFNLGY